MFAALHSTSRKNRFFVLIFPEYNINFISPLQLQFNDPDINLMFDE